MKGKKKIFVLDTNVLVHNPSAIFNFTDNDVVLPITVIEELDKLKSRNDEVGRNARESVRILDSLRLKGSLCSGVKTDKGGTIRIEPNNKDVLDKIPLGIDLSVPDNRILAVAYNLFKGKEEGIVEVWVISKDLNMRVKADAIGLLVADSTNDRVDSSNFYSGWRELSVSSQEIERFYQEKILDLGGDFYPNEFVHLVASDNSKKTVMARFCSRRKEFVSLDKSFNSAFNLASANMEQRMALEVLLNSDIELVSLVGQAGTGKTLLALAAGLQMVIDLEKYDKILVWRPIMPMGKDLGYLPGGEQEKLMSWMRPIYDNVEFLISKKFGRKSINGLTKDVSSYLDKVNAYIGPDSVITPEALTYVRGRSVPRQYIIVDEAQNLSPLEVKTIISRAGEGTKIVLTGDPEQIDNPYLDSESNGLSYVVDRLKSFATVASIVLKKTERSPLASIAAKYL